MPAGRPAASRTSIWVLAIGLPMGIAPSIPPSHTGQQLVNVVLSVGP
jgi:hypothetical protein